MSQAHRTYRHQGSEAAVFFIHGFTGDAAETWGDFPALVATNPDLAGFDVYSWGYPSRLNLANVVTKHFWTDDPGIATIGQGLRTLLGNFAQSYQKIILVGHSMGGLVIQSFILEELLRGSLEHLGRVTEVVLYATPSGGLKKASWGAFLKNQIADMSYYGEFIQRLRGAWKELVDDRRAGDLPELCFRLTLVAGMQDEFVPQESSLDPFPLDEKEIVPGNHITLVKPGAADDLAYLVLQKRLLRGTPTAPERALVLGRDQRVIDLINRIRAAEEIGDVDDLDTLATKLLQSSSASMPLVDRALGLALSNYERFQPAAALLGRYLDFVMPGEKARPFRGDVQAVLQLAVSLSGAGDITGALTRLNELSPEEQNQSRTLGIRAGRIKQQWRRFPKMAAIGQRALLTYKAGYELAKETEDVEQLVFNGINYAYLRLALNQSSNPALPSEVLHHCLNRTNPDYWTHAAAGEALLLLGRYADAALHYEAAFGQLSAPRYWTTTAVQALDILRRQGRPAGSEEVAAIIHRYVPGAEEQARALEALEKD